VVAINCSFGGTTEVLLERDAIRMAGDAGIVVCAAAGNNGNNNDIILYYPACSDASNIIAVAATDNRDKLAGFSNYGLTNVDLAAPGSNILSTYSTPSYSSITGTLKVVSSGSTYTVLTYAYSSATTGLTAMARFCPVWTNITGMAGQIAVMKWDSVAPDGAQVRAAMNAGCVGVVLHHYSGGYNQFATLGSPDEWIPTANLQLGDRLSLTSQLPNVVTLTLPPPYQYLDGTSMATPVVAGAVAMMAMQFPGDTVAQRINRILSSVDPKTNLTTKVATGGRLNILNATDTDHDGVGDWWEMRNFGSLTANLATYQGQDTDHDGFSDYQEFLTGSSPTNAQSVSVLEAESPGFSKSTGFSFRWNSTAYRTYSVERSTNMGASFTPLATNVPASPPNNLYVDGSATNLPSLFYRVTIP
jgi:hypothetical protein